MDDLYTDYINRVVRMTLPESHRVQVQHIQPSAKYQRSSEGTMQPVAFPGYSVITPPWRDDAVNTPTYRYLEEFQTALLQQLPDGLLVEVPPDSFHMTIADLIWDDRYRHAANEPSFDQQLRNCLTQSFAAYRDMSGGNEAPLQWQLLGFIVMPRAIAMCLAPKSEPAYDRILALRRTIYQNPTLIALGIDQQYHLTAHITLGYFTDQATTVDRTALCETLAALNQRWLDETGVPPLQLTQAELRKFEDMTKYTREPDWPTVHL